MPAHHAGFPLAVYHLKREAFDAKMPFPPPGMPSIRLGVWFPQPCHASIATACAVVRISTGWGVVLCLPDLTVAELPDGSF